MEKIQSMNWNKFSKFEQYTPVILQMVKEKVMTGGQVNGQGPDDECS